MDPTPVRRRLTAILAADAVGYSSRMGEDEERTHRTLAGHRHIIFGLIAAHDGRMVGTAGDSVLAEFGSSVEAVRCAVEVQEALATRNDLLPQTERLQFRIGVNLGDVIVEGNDILGDGVNVASRLESIAEPGGICVSSSVFDQISGKLNLGFEDIGQQSLKNIARPVRAYRFAGTSGTAVPKRAQARSRSFPVAWVAGALAVAAAAAAGVYVMQRLQTPESAATPPPAAAPPAPAPAALQEASEETKLRLQLAEAERAKAEADLARIRAEAAAKTAAPPPAATSPAPAQATPSTPPPPASSPAPPTALTYTGGFAQNECAGNDQDDAPTTSRSPFRIVDGEIVISAGVPGRAGSMLIRGRPGPNGELTLNGSVVGRGRGRNMTLPAFYQGQIVKGRGLLKGRIGQRPCTILLQLK